MNARTFHSLYYTDCRPGQGLRGGAGFQFQAVSTGTTDEMMSVVQRSALYEAPMMWMREKRPVRDYPPSFVHLHGAVFATARGIYLGAEAGGNREGNQFTHALATTDENQYGSVRPIQLWGARWWAEQPAEGLECPSVPAEPEPGQLGLEAVREWTLAQDEGESLLLTLHSALDQVHEPNAPRVVFVSEDTETVVRWIAAATLLLPQERALRIGFKVFATNPEYSSQEIIAVHPHWAGSLAVPGRHREFVVFNLVTGEYGPIEPTPAARHWVPRFLNEDPFDVLDAIELAHRFARGRGQGATAADLLAAGVHVLDEAPDDPESVQALAEWLARPPLAEPDFVEPVLDVVLAAAPSMSALSELIDANSPRHGEIRLALLRGEIDAIVRGDPVGEPISLPFWRWSPDEYANGCALVETAASVVGPEDMDGLLRTAQRFDLQPQVGKFLDAANRFVSWWARHHSADLDPIAWPCGADLKDLLRDELNRELAGPRGREVQGDVDRHWWRLLLPRATDPFLRLDVVVLSRAVAEGGTTRERTIANVRAQALTDRRPGFADAAYTALFSTSSPTPEELEGFLHGLPDIPERLIERVLDEIAETEVTAGQLDVFRALDGRLGKWRRQRELLEQDKRLDTWLELISRRRATSPGAISEQVWRARAPEVVDVLLRTHCADAVRFAMSGGPEMRSTLAYELPGAWDAGSERTGDRAVVLAFLLTRREDVEEQVRDPLETVLAAWTKTHRSADHRRIQRRLQGVGDRHVAMWREWLAEVSGKKPRTRRAWKFLGKQEK